MNSKPSLVRACVSLGALLGIVSCSGGGSGVGGAGVAAPAMPAADARTSVALQAPSSVALANEVGIDATELASLAVPQTSDVAAVGDAVDPLAYGATLTGTYHGLINNWADGIEEKGGTTFSIDRSGTSVTGSGTAREGQYVVSTTLSGTVVSEYPHSVGVDLTLVSSNAMGDIGCSYSGTARRYTHVFLGVLVGAVPGCGVVFFKVHPVAAN